jgi:hypothetical protein
MPWLSIILKYYLAIGMVWTYIHTRMGDIQGEDMRGTDISYWVGTKSNDAKTAKDGHLAIYSSRIYAWTVDTRKG